MDEIEIVVDVGNRRNDCFGIMRESLLRKFSTSSDGIGGVVAVELRNPSGGCGEVLTIGCISDVQASTRLAGCSGLLSSSRALKNGQLSLTPSFAADLGVRAGDSLTCVSAARYCPVAAAVVVAPASVDDSEVVELNALRIESTLLQYLTVVFVGQKVTIPVHPGVTARLIVENITAPHQSQPSRAHVAARMTEGTELHVATRARVPPPLSDNISAPPQCGVLRLHIAKGKGDFYVAITKSTAGGLQWADNMAVGLLHSASLTTILGSPDPAQSSNAAATVEPSALRTHAVRVTVRVVAENELFEDGVLYILQQEGDVDTSEMSTSTCWGNVLVTPHPPETINLTDVGTWIDTVLCKLPGMWPTSEYCRPMTDVVSVHGDAPSSIAALLKPIAEHGSSVRCQDVVQARPNVLLCGARGTGKSTIAVSAACSARNVFVRYLSCEEGSNFTKQLSLLSTMCLLNAPSVLILDGLDVIAPAQAEGHVNAVSTASLAILESCLRLPQCESFTKHFGLPNSCLADRRGRERVQVLAIASHRDALHESVRSARNFGHIVQLEASLGAPQRLQLIRQGLFEEGISEPVVNTLVRDNASLKRLVTLRTENFVAFDAETFSRRLAHRLHACPAAALRTEDLQVAIEDVAHEFESLAHQGAGFKKDDSSTGDRASWEDVGGLQEVKKVLYDTLILPSKMPKLFQKLPLRTRSGVLLFGPSGCGKTYALQTIVAAEQLNCIVVNGPEIFGKYIGQSEQKIREIFERAQSAAPSVVFFDEFDSVAPQRGNDNTGVTDRVVNQLLCYLDGVEARTNVFVVAASSRPDLIDAALLRPGRLDQAVYCPLPDDFARRDILTAHLKKIPHRVSDDELALLAERTHGWTSADLAALVATAHMTETQRTVDLSRELGRLNVGAQMNTPTSTSAGNEQRQFSIVRAPVKDANKLDEVWSARSLTANEDHRRNAVSVEVSDATHQKSPTVTLSSMEAAFLKSRRSMSDKDIAKQEALFRRFMQSREPGGGHEPLVVPGTRVTMA